MRELGNVKKKKYGFNDLCYLNLEACHDYAKVNIRIFVFVCLFFFFFWHESSSVWLLRKLGIFFMFKIYVN